MTPKELVSITITGISQEHEVSLSPAEAQAFQALRQAMPGESDCTVMALATGKNIFDEGTSLDIRPRQRPGSHTF